MSLLRAALLPVDTVRFRRAKSLGIRIVAVVTPALLLGTGLGAKPVGALVNLEVDVLAKYTARLLSFDPKTQRAAPRAAGLDPQEVTV